MLRTIKGEIVLGYIIKHKDMPDRTLASLIYSKNKETFNDVESVRSLIRTYRGHSGQKRRELFKHYKEHYKPITNDSNPFKWIPDSHMEPVDVWRLPKAYKNVLLISDIHIPYHSVEALRSCFNFAKSEDIDCIYINGDMLDFYMLSFHEKDMRKRPTTREEVEMGRAFLKGLRAEFPKAKIYFKPANHEHRLERYLSVKCKELDLDDFRIDILLRMGELGIEYIPRRAKTYFGKLLVEHGDRIKGSGGVSPARTLFLRYKRHSICGHFHKKTEHSARIYDGSPIVTFSVGSLCDLEPEYFEVNEHTNGFAIIKMDGEDFRVHNYTIEKGKVY